MSLEKFEVTNILFNRNNKNASALGEIESSAWTSVLNHEKTPASAACLLRTDTDVHTLYDPKSSTKSFIEQKLEDYEFKRKV